MALRPYLSRNARRQIAALAKRQPELLDRVIEVISELVHDPDLRLHKAEMLRGDLAGYRSVRLTLKDRLIYRVEADRLLIESVEGHYGDR